MWLLKLFRTERECGGLHPSPSPPYDGIRYVREKLRWEPLFPAAPKDFPRVVPDRPKEGMHRRTYYRYLARYRRYQEKYRRDSMREMLAILGR